MNNGTDAETASGQDRRAVTAVNRRHWILIVISLAALVGVGLYLLTAVDTVDVEKAKAPPPLQLVSIEICQVGTETAEVVSFSEVRPRWSAELRSAVSGRVLEVRKKALAGERVELGTNLIAIENSKYRADLAAAELALKEAKLGLRKARNATMLARKQYQRSGKKPPNDLALHLPELKIAEASVKTAKERLAAVRQQLEDTTITAPFSGFITERFVSPGQTVSPGDRLVKLVDNEVFELAVELGRRDWKLLKKPLAGQTAKVADQSGKIVAKATILRGGGFLNEQTRQHKVFMEISKAGTTPILSGDFVRVILPGVTVHEALSIPASALTQEGYVWFVDDNDRLNRTTPKVLFRRQERVIIKAPEGGNSWRTVKTPLVSFLPGQKVQVKKAEF